MIYFSRSLLLNILKGFSLFQGLLVASVVCQGLRTDGTTKKPTENTTLAGPDNTTQEPSKNAIDTSKDVVANSSMTGLIRTSGNGALILKGSKSGDNQSEIVLANVTAAPVFAPDGTLVKLIVDSGSGKGSALVDNKNKTSTKLTQVIVQLNHRSVCHTAYFSLIIFFSLLNNMACCTVPQD